MERSGVDVDGSRIEFGILRTPRRKTVAVEIDPVAGILVRAPRDLAVGQIERIVRGKAGWILARAQNAPEFLDGRPFGYLGHEYRLRVVRDPDAAPAAVRRADDELVVRVASLDDASAIRASLIGWYRVRAARAIPDRVSHWASATRLEPAAVLIRDQRRRWGSVDARNVVRLNWRLVQAPIRLIDYVVVHELVHLVHRNHGPAYWAAVETIMPDHAERRRELRRTGPSLFW